ncbi:competence protein ComGC [Lentilactobacillus fungorum]|uniref:Competence protein ComGC n=1 Tax=Lentilactobacillus fungorum TaxID=2201250 RepID=A0ABQ3VXL0_9LACO|nr:competence type IV pilus major pilin ComGC [Lentilactobacillus fungorum]GHP12649.1 competence protein ComGC [Lentilactobacillus fungorum]
MKKKIRRTKPAFTLIEMTIVLFIISLLILIIIPNLSNQRKHAQSVHSSAMNSVIQAQVDAYTSQHPNVKSVGFEDLTKEGYLTKKQTKQAKDEGLKITNNEVTK